MKTFKKCIFFLMFCLMMFGCVESTEEYNDDSDKVKTEKSFLGKDLFEEETTPEEVETTTKKKTEKQKETTAKKETTTEKETTTQEVITRETTTQPPTTDGRKAYAVNMKNGKIHMVGACSATGDGEKAMTNPKYFDTYEEAEQYSRDIKPKLESRKCGNCW